VQLWAKDIPGAVASYEESLTIRQKLAEDGSNTQAQRDLQAAVDKVEETKANQRSASQ
jgi:hypothetical protein